MPLAVITGASTGIGRALAQECAEHGFDLVIAANEASIVLAGDELRATGVDVATVEADLATPEGVDKLLATIAGRNVDALLANAGISLGHAFLDQEPEAWRRVVDTNITGTLLLIHQVGRQMRDADRGRILMTGSIVGFMPGPFEAVYNGTKAFLHSFSFALRNELKDTAVTVTCLMPGATETDVFERADMQDTKVGRAKKDDPAMVAAKGFAAMMKGEADVVAGWHNKLQAAIAHVAPAAVTAELHRRLAQPKD